MCYLWLSFYVSGLILKYFQTFPTIELFIQFSPNSLCPTGHNKLSSNADDGRRAALWDEHPKSQTKGDHWTDNGAQATPIRHHPPEHPHRQYLDVIMGVDVMPGARTKGRRPSSCSFSICELRAFKVSLKILRAGNYSRKIGSWVWGCCRSESFRGQSILNFVGAGWFEDIVWGSFISIEATW